MNFDQPTKTEQNHWGIGGTESSHWNIVEDKMHKRNGELQESMLHH